MLDYKTIIIKRYALGMSGREIAKQIGASKSGVNEFLRAFEECGTISYPLPNGITNYGIAELVYGNLPGNNGRNPNIEYPDYEDVNRQLSTRKNMTLVFLWNRYKKKCEETGRRYYQYRQFCEHYAEWCDENAETLHFNAVIGEKMEVDFAGKTFRITDPLTGESHTVVVFVAILPYSQYIYAEGMLSTKEPQWIDVNNHALDYFGGVPSLVVCDNCKQAVTTNEDWIAPELNRDYAEWAEHNQTAILPAKVRKPKYKSSVENAVGILEKGFFHEMEERQYFSLEQFNQDLLAFLGQLNREPFKKKAHNRYFYWEEEKQELMPLPSVHYEYTERRTAKVSSDFHVRFDNAYYSVNKAYVHKEVFIKATADIVRIYSRQGEFLCEWPRAEYKGKWSTDPGHLPANYQGYGQWNAAFFINKARLAGPFTEAVIRGILKCRKYEVQTYRMCLGVINFGGRYGKPVLEECCRRAIDCGKTTYTFIKNTIPAVADEMGAEVCKGGAAPAEKGGYAMGSDATDIDRLLSRSRELADRQGGGGQVMLTGNSLLNTLVDELNELGLPNMAAELERLYASPGFLEMDRLTLVSELISPEYRDKVSKRINNRLRSAKLIGCPAELGNCMDSKEREYLPSGIPQMLSSMDFIPKGFNICILGASDTGKTYLAKAIGIKACTDYRVGYFHCEELLESLSAQKQIDYGRYERKMSGLLKQDLVILDDFLLHTIMDEAEIKILFALLEGRAERQKSTIICSQRAPENWKPMIMNDEISANAIVKRATKHYTVMINRR